MNMNMHKNIIMNMNMNMNMKMDTDMDNDMNILTDILTKSKSVKGRRYKEEKKHSFVKLTLENWFLKRQSCKMNLAGSGTNR